MNFKLFKELKKAEDQQNDFHVEDKGLIELKSNYFAENMLVVVAEGKITKPFNVIHTS
jgi:hypothetical protein